MISLIVAALAASPPPTIVVGPPKDRAQRRVCRTVETTGSRMDRGRICKRAAEWELEKRNAEQILVGKQNLYDEEQSRRSPAAPQ